MLYLGAAALVILAAIFSSYGKKAPASASAKNAAPQPLVQDNTENNVQDLKDQVDAAKQRQAQQAAAEAALDPSLANATAAQQNAAAGYGPNGQGVNCVPGQPCPPQGGYRSGGGMPSPAQQEAQMLASKERDKAFDGRFASNLAYVEPASQQAVQSQVPTPPSAPAALLQGRLWHQFIRRAPTQQPTSVPRRSMSIPPRASPMSSTKERS